LGGFNINSSLIAFSKVYINIMDKIKVGIAGCLGRMGQELVKATTKDKRIKFVGGYDLKNSKTHSNDIFKKANVIINRAPIK